MSSTSLRGVEKIWAEAHPAFAKRAVAALQEVALIKPVQVVCVYRSEEKQLEAYHSGASKTIFGMHNATAGGNPASLAVDIVDADDKPYSEEPEFYAALAIAAKKWRLRTGLLFDLPQNMKIVRQLAIDQRNRGDLVALIAPPIGKRGWDPLHLEVGLGLLEEIRPELDRIPVWSL